MESGCTRALAEFVANTKYEDIKPDAIDIAKRGIMDTLGVAIRGSKEEVSGIILRHVLEERCHEDSSIIATNFRSSMQNSALCNGVFAHVLDYDDIYDIFRIHPSAPILSACLALSEKIGASGVDLLQAYVIGVEVIGAINRGLGPSHYERGWHSTATVGGFGAMAASAKLLHLDIKQIQVAFGIATSLISGSRQNFGTMTKAIHAGNAAKYGVLSATYAKNGITADEEILDKPMGFAIFSDRGDWDPQSAIKALGNPWAIVQPGLRFKSYPSWGGTHKALDALFQILREEPLQADDIERVTVITSKPSAEMTHNRPYTGLQGKFNLEYCLASGIIDGHLGIESFTDEAVLRPEIEKAYAKVRFQSQPSMPVGAVRIEINRTDGSNVSREVLHPLGSSANPMTWLDIEKKYRDCAGSVLPPESVDESVAMMKNFEKLDSVSTLIDLLAKEDK
jgi:2-methylcitrate dehydratase PrpD